MFTRNLKERLAFLAFLHPVSNTAAVGAEGFNTGTADLRKYHRFCVKFWLGTRGAAATWNCTVRQTNNSNGTSATNVSGLYTTTTLQIANQVVTMEGRCDQLTARYVVGSMYDATGTAASVIAMEVWGLNPRFGQASDDNNTNVNTQTVMSP